MSETNLKIFNGDDMTLALFGLQTFTRNWCMDNAETDKNGEPKFRCDECRFRDGSFCMIKEQAKDIAGQQAALEVSAMRW